MTPAQASSIPGEEELDRRDGADEGREGYRAVILVLDEEVVPVVGVQRGVAVFVEVFHEFVNDLWYGGAAMFDADDICIYYFKLPKLTD